MLSAFSNDLRFALRLLVKSPGTTAVMILMLAVAIGVNSAVFSFVSGLLFRPLNLPQVEQIISVWERNVPLSRERADVAPGNFRDWEQQNQSFHILAAFQWWDVHLSHKEETEQFQGFRVSSAFFQVLGVSPALGRTLNSTDALPGNDAVVVISHNLWQHRFGGDPALLGKQLQLNGREHTVVGIMPEGFEFPVTSELWIPLVLQGELENERTKRFLQVCGRLKPGVLLDQARAEFKVIASRLSQLRPDTNKDWTVALAPLRERIIQDSGTRDPLVILMVAAGCVWLLGCANVVNLQLASVTRRRKELAIRTALGARPRQLTRQLLVESLVVSLLAGICSLVFALLCIHGIKLSLPMDIIRYLSGWNSVGLDSAVLGYTFGMATASGILAGLVPAMLISRTNPYEMLKESSRGSSHGRQHHRLRNLLIIAEVVLALLLLVCAGQLLQGFWAVAHSGKGFTSDGVLTFKFTLPSIRYATEGDRHSFVVRAQAELARLPGVRAATFGSHLPFAHKGWDLRPVRVAGRPSPNGEDIQVAFQAVTPEYFQVLRVPLRAGRFFREGDTADQARVVLVSESLAQRFWQGEAVGQLIQVPTLSSNAWTDCRVVGVVGDVKKHWAEPDLSLIYLPLAQETSPTLLGALQTTSDPSLVIASVRSAVRKVDARLPLVNVKTLDQIIQESMVAIRVPAAMLTFLGLLTLLLASAGVYSVLAYAVRQQTPEIGIRMALGAQPSQVLRMILGVALRLVGIGVAVGLPLALAVGRLLASVLFGVGALSLWALVFAVFLLGAMALLAAFIPARQATRVDPLIALRAE